MPLKNLTGQRFGRLVVQSREENNGRRTMWRCVCDCGASAVVWAGSLQRGRTKSCGCLARETKAAINLDHGMSKTRLYRVWCAMRRRCEDSARHNFQWYGGRGVKVCAEFSDFRTFKAWADSSGYSDNLTIDRIDSRGDYTPENCRWVPPEQQSINRLNVERTEDGVPWFQVAESNGIGRRNYWSRIQRGWSHQRAATQPITR